MRYAGIHNAIMDFVSNSELIGGEQVVFEDVPKATSSLNNHGVFIFLQKTITGIIIEEVFDTDSAGAPDRFDMNIQLQYREDVATLSYSYLEHAFVMYFIALLDHISEFIVQFLNISFVKEENNITGTLSVSVNMKDSYEGVPVTVQDLKNVR